MGHHLGDKGCWVFDRCADNGIKLTTFFNSLAQVAIDEHYTHEINRDEIHSEILSLRQWIDSWSGGDEDEQIEYYNNLARLAELNKLLIVG